MPFQTDVKDLTVCIVFKVIPTDNIFLSKFESKGKSDE